MRTTISGTSAGFPHDENLLNTRFGGFHHSDTLGGDEYRKPLTVEERESRELINDLSRLGITVRFEGGRVRWKAPPGRMTVGLIRRIKRTEAYLSKVLSASAELPKGA